MNLTKKTEAEIWQVYDTWLHSYLNGDVKTYDSYFHKDYHFIGSTNNEEFLSKKDTTQFFAETADQLAGKCDLRNETKILEQFEGLVFITHLFDAWFKVENDFAYYGRFRFTNALTETKEGWRFVYQHFSTTDPKTEEGETIGFDRVNAENQELREVIKRNTFQLEEKNRELQIEAALQRIRNQALSMQHSEDLLDIVVTMRTEFVNLGNEAHYFWHMLWLEDNYEKAMTSGDGTKIGFVMKLPKHIHGNIPLLAKWEKSNKPTVVYAMDVEEALDYVDKMVSLGDFKNIDLQAPTEVDIWNIGGLTFVMARTTHGEIGYSLPGVVKNPPKESIALLVQFAKAFDFAHRRFLDLQKAEKQAKETQIELALEKVRSRSMAMQKSEELAQAAELLYQEFFKLGITPFSCGYLINDETKKQWNVWMTDANDDTFNNFWTLPFTADKYLENRYQSWQEKEPFHCTVLEGNNNIKHHELIAQYAPWKKSSLKQLPKCLVLSSSHFKHGHLLIVTDQVLSEEVQSILVRFANVFEHTYTRFLDLQKAEKQARENQIELALEKIRNRTMAMQHSEELNETAELMFAEIKKLDIELWSCGFSLWYDDDSYFIGYNPGPDGKMGTPLKIPLTEDVFFKTIRKAKRKADDFLVFESRDESLKKTYEYMDTLPVVGETMRGFVQAGFSLPTYQVTHCGFFEDGHLMFITEQLNTENTEIFKRFTTVFRQTYTRFLDLKKAEAQAREAEIEAALERIRSRSMAMHKTDELSEVIVLLFRQLEFLNLVIDTCYIDIFDEDNQGFNIWVGTGTAIYPEQVHLPYFKHPIHQLNKKARQNNVEFFTIDEDEKSRDLYFEHFYAKAEGIDVPEKRKEHIAKGLGISGSAALGEHAGITMWNYRKIIYSSEENEILTRVNKVFQQTYTRFLDLQKAEAQAREAQIEAALEKVRSVALGLNTSEDMLEVTQVLYEQLLELGFKNIRNAIIDINNEENETFLDYDYSHEMGGTVTLMSYDDDPVLEEQVRVIAKSTDKFSETLLQGQQLQDLIEMRRNNGEADDPRLFNCDAVSYNLYAFGNGAIGISNFGVLGDNEKAILDRFRNVFTFAYKRYDDLQKAEAQMREIQLETSLEKVRSIALGMQSRNDMLDVAQELFEQLRELGFVDIRNAIIDVHNPDNETFWDYDYSDAMSGSITLLSYKNDPKLEEQYRKIIATTNGFYEEVIEGQDLKDYVEMRIRNGEKDDPRLRKVNLLSYYLYSFGNGVIGISNFGVLTEKEKAILERFRNVFTFAYKRYGDLQKSEAQAREAQIETALERVRNSTLAMQHTNEMQTIVDTIFEQLANLGIEMDAVGMSGVMDATKAYEVWVGGSNFSKPLTIPFSEATQVQRDYNSINTNRDELFTKTYDGKIKKEYIDFLLANNSFPKKLEKKMVESDAFSTSISYSKNSGIQIVRYSEEPYTAEDNAILVRFAKVFEQAYIRFLDLQVKEEQAQKIVEEKQRLEQTLQHLQQTQKQLIQSEKMASLGELTAGIAHEIQNPLNFVNNFSEVSNELLEELEEEMAAGDLEEVKAILGDIKQNLEKITHHGKRADGIVKGMLQHSRKSSAEKKPTDLNKLVDEYLRLAYHGLRAKDKSFNATMETHFDETLDKVNIIPQDIGRMLLNLITNAFYATDEKKNVALSLRRPELVEGSKGNLSKVYHASTGLAGNGYEPTVSVTTRNLKNAITIAVKDNGTGMPQHIIDKIFQPFFTTKPTGQGTGLGLSMSYDIVKAHGGTIEVISEEGKGTEFIIQLPTNKE